VAFGYPDKNQELDLEIQLYSNYYNDYYIFSANSKYTNENNIDFEFYIKYEGKIYSGSYFFANENEAKKLIPDIRNSIIDNIKNLNSIIKQEKTDYNKTNSYIDLIYKIDLLLQDSENIFTELNLENIFNPIISILKSWDVKLEEKPLEELIKERKIKISLNDDNLKIEIEKVIDYISKLSTYITYNNVVSDNLNYEIKLGIIIENNFKYGDINFKINSNYSNIFNNYEEYFELMEFLSPKRILNRLINPIIQNKNDIEKAINKFKFNDALTIINELYNGVYNNYIINLLNEKLTDVIIGNEVIYDNKKPQNIFTYLTRSLKYRFDC